MALCLCRKRWTGSASALLDTQLQQTRGHELKFIYPQDTLSPDRFADMDFEHFFLQPMDTGEAETTLHTMCASCNRLLPANPQWRLSLQTHKIIGID